MEPAQPPMHPSARPGPVPPTFGLPPATGPIAPPGYTPSPPPGVPPTAPSTSPSFTQRAPLGFVPPASTTGVRSAGSWNIVGGSAAIFGGLIALGSLILPWLHVELLIFSSSLSPLELIGVEQQLGSDGETITFFGLLILLVAFFTGIGGIVVGIISIIASGIPLRVTAILAMAAGALLFLVSALFVGYIALADMAAELGSLSPSLGVAAAIFAAILMAGGGIATVAHSLAQRGTATATRMPGTGPMSRL